MRHLTHLSERILSVLLIGLILGSLTVGCGQTQPDANTVCASSEAITVTDLAGVSHTFPGPLHKVAVQWSCAGGPFMTMSALLGEYVPQYLACIDDSPEKYRADVWAQCLTDLPALAEVPVIGSVGEELNLEGVFSSGAEAFLCPLELKPLMDESLTAKLESVDIPVVYVDFHQETLENHTKSTLLLGQLFGQEARAQEIVEFYTAHRLAVQERVQQILADRERPDLYIEVGMMGPSDFGNSFDNQYSWGGIAYQAGGNSIGDGIVFNLGPLDSEYVLSKDPDKIILAGACGSAVPDAVQMGYGVKKEETVSHMAAFFQRPGWSELSAFRDKQVYAINHGLAREMYDCACFEFFAKVCFPEEFSDISPEQTLKDYYSRFMPYQLDGVWFVL